MLRRVVSVSLSLVAAGCALWVTAAALSQGGHGGRARAALLFLAAAAIVGVVALVRANCAFTPVSSAGSCGRA